jgi:hypothetical protein
MRSIPLLTAAAVTLAAASGCGTILKRTYYEARGASAKVLQRDEGVDPTKHLDLTAYDAIHVGRIENQALGLLPPNFERDLRAAIVTAVEKSDKIGTKGDNPLTVDINLVHYENPGVLSEVVSPFHIGVALLTLKDKSGHEIARLTLVGKSKAARSAPRDVADAMGARLVKYVTGEPDEEEKEKQEKAEKEKPESDEKQ